MSIWYDRDRFLFTIQLCQLTAVDDITDYLGLSSVSWQQLMTSQTIWVSALSVDNSWRHHRLFGSQLCRLTAVDDITDYLGLSSVSWQQLTSQIIWVSALSVDRSWPQLTTSQTIWVSPETSLCWHHSDLGQQRPLLSWKVKSRLVNRCSENWHCCIYCCMELT